MSSEEIKNIVRSSIDKALNALLSKTGFKVSLKNLDFLENIFIPILSDSLRGDIKRIRDIELMFQIFLFSKNNIDDINENFFFTFSVFLEKQNKILTSRFAKPFVFSLPFTKPNHSLRIVVEFTKSPQKSELVKLLEKNNINYYHTSDWIEIKTALEDVEVSRLKEE
jgi:hypothetical protein